MTTVKNLLELIPDSFSMRRNERWGHYFPLLAEDAYGVQVSGFDILKLYQLCGPIVVVNRANQRWDTDCVITLTYNHATQVQEADVSSSTLTYLGSWNRGRLPSLDDIEFSYGFEIGQYLLVVDIDVTLESDDLTPLAVPIPVDTYMYYDGITWLEKTLNWKTTKVYNQDVKLPIYSPVLDAGVPEEKEVVITIPAGKRQNVQTFATLDYVYKITSINVTGGDEQHIEIYCLSDSGIRLLNLHGFEEIEDILSYILRRYFVNFDICPEDDCDYNCSVCGGYGYVDNTLESMPDDCISSDYLTKKFAEAKGVKFERSWERYRWRVWSKYWWVKPTRENIQEFVGHFTGIEPDRIDIETTNYPELIWTIRIPIKSGKSILGTDDYDYKTIVNDIVIAGGSIIVKDVLIYYEGLYDEYYSDIIPLTVASYSNPTVTLDTDDLTLDYTWLHNSINDMSATYTNTGSYKITTGTNITNTYLEVGQVVLTKIYDITPTLLLTEYARVGSVNNILVFYYDYDIGVTTENSISVREQLNMIIVGEGTVNYEGTPYTVELYDGNLLEFPKDVGLSTNDTIFLDTRHQKNVMDLVVRGKRLIDYAGDHIGKRNSFDFHPTITYKLDTIDVLTDNGSDDKITIYDYGYFIRTSHDDADTLTHLGCVEIGGNEYDIITVEQGDYDTDGDVIDLRLTLSGFDYTSASVGDEVKIYLNGYNTDTSGSADIDDFDHFNKKLIYNECYYRV